MDIHHLRRRAPVMLGIAVLLAAAAVAFLVRTDRDVLAANIGITVFEGGGALVQVPYRADGASGNVSVAIDMDGDGAFGDDETVVRDFPARPRKYWNSNYFFTPSGTFGDTADVRVTFGEETIRRKVSVGRSAGPDTEQLLVGVTRPEESMKGQTVVRPPANPPVQAPAPAAVEPVIAQREADVPDLRQRTDECAPTAAANSLISLAREHGQDDRLPADSLTMVDELKADMRWTPADGVVPDDFVRGKNEWAAKKGLPITTAVVGNTRGQGTLDALAGSLATGGAGELRLRFGTPVGNGGYRMSGGHLVTIVGITKNDHGTFVDVNDPLTPSGTETYPVDANGMLIGYPRRGDGVAFIGIGFTQTWTGTDLDPMTDAEVRGIREFAGEKNKIKALKVGNRYVPLGEVHIADFHKGTCEARHWHANVPGSTRDTNGKLIAEIHQYCGYGKESEVPVVDVELP